VTEVIAQYPKGFIDEERWVDVTQSPLVNIGDWMFLRQGPYRQSVAI
jgi:hypothetical protein